METLNQQMKSQVNELVTRAAEAFDNYRKFSSDSRSQFLRAIGEGIEDLGDKLIHTVVSETHLSEARVKGEKGRTINQLNLFAQLIENGDWLQASVDTADPLRMPLPKHDLRKMLFPMGPVVIFGASNFPLAFSTAGGDTASALAAGCSVIVKSHPAHPKTSSMVAEVIRKAIANTNMPSNVFQHVADGSIEIGQELVQHDNIKAATFTGSYSGGKALFDIANKRKEPIPFFAEMGSINPVVLLPEAVLTNKGLSSLLVESITSGVGQFCTKPGLLLIMDGISTDDFLHEVALKIGQMQPSKMLYPGITSSYREKRSKSLSQQGIHVLAEVQDDDAMLASPALTSVTAREFLSNEMLHEEVFGPYAIVVRCKTEEEMSSAIAALQGQLTCTVFGNKRDLKKYNAIVDLLQQRCGRLIFNGVPTGVEVVKSMHHGGPFPATTDSRFSSVGTDAIYRFMRPLCFQNAPEEILPAELKNYNALNVLRCVNGVWTRNHIVQ